MHRLCNLNFLVFHPLRFGNMPSSCPLSSRCVFQRWGDPRYRVHRRQGLRRGRVRPMWRYRLLDGRPRLGLLYR